MFTVIRRLIRLISRNRMKTSDHQNCWINLEVTGQMKHCSLFAAEFILLYNEPRKGPHSHNLEILNFYHNVAN